MFWCQPQVDVVLFVVTAQWGIVPALIMGHHLLKVKRDSYDHPTFLYHPFSLRTRTDSISIYYRGQIWIKSGQTAKLSQLRRRFHVVGLSFGESLQRTDPQQSLCHHDLLQTGQEQIVHSRQAQHASLRDGETLLAQAASTDKNK